MSELRTLRDNHIPVYPHELLTVLETKTTLVVLVKLDYQTICQAKKSAAGSCLPETE